MMREMMRKEVEERCEEEEKKERSAINKKMQEIKKLEAVFKRKVFLT